MKTNLLLLFIFILKVSQAQNLELVWHQGESPVDVLYNGNEDHVKMSIIGHNALLPPSPKLDYSIQFRSHIANVGSQDAINVQLIVVQKSSSGTTGKTLSSIPIDTLKPGDTSSYIQTLTSSISSYDMSFYSYFLLFLKEANKPTVLMDTLYMRSIIGNFSSDPVSVDFGNYGNTFTTDSLGDDGFGFAYLMPIEASQQLLGLQLPFGPQTIAGGDVDVSIYDSIAYDSVSGTFSTSPFFTGTNTITHSLIRGPQKSFVSFSGPLHFPHFSGTEYYWFVVRFYSYSGSFKIDLYNDTTVVQPDGACLVSTKNTGGWIPVSQGPRWLQNPSFTLEMYLPVFEPIQITESTKNFGNIALYPNPSNGSFYLQGLPGQSAAVKVHDALGRELLNVTEVREKQALSLSGQPAGLYLVEILQGGRVIQRTKLMVE